MATDRNLDKRRIECPTAPPSTGFRSQGLIAGDFLFLSGMIGLRHEPDGSIRATGGNLAEQVGVALSHLQMVTDYAVAPLDKVVELSAFVVPPQSEALVRAGVKDHLGYLPPLVNIRQVADVAMHSLLELDWIVNLDPNRTGEDAASILSPLGHTETVHPIASGPFLIRNGQTAPGDTLYDQTRNLLGAIDADLTARGSSLDRLVKLTVFIADFPTYPRFNTATKELFADIIPPARSVVVAPAITGDAQLRVDWVALA